MHGMGGSGEDIANPDIRQVPFNGRMVTLSSPSSQQLTLEGIGPKVIAWEPCGKEAFEVEVRARIMSDNQAAEDFPVVRWRTEISAGNAVWKEPFPTPDIGGVPGPQVLDFRVPARGMVWRTGARQFRIAFYADGTVANASAVIKAVLQVSILPVFGTTVDTYPFSDGGTFNILDPKASPFPMVAREWKLQDIRGVPVTLGTIPAIALLNANGAPYFGADANAYADWQPIPFEAIGYLAPGAFAAFR